MVIGEGWAGFDKKFKIFYAGQLLKSPGGENTPMGYRLLVIPEVFAYAL